MQHIVRVVASATQDFRFELNHEQPLSGEDARVWLDQQFLALECEPLRASGKLLLADKVLVVAQAGGPKLLGDATWGPMFARAASAALHKPMITIDLSSMSVTY